MVPDATTGGEMGESATQGLNLRHLRLFCHVVEAGSVHAAARRGGLTQPAVSQAIRRLEERLAVRLFERSRKGTRPSAEGRALHRRAEHMLGFLRQMHRWVDDPIAFDNRLTMAHLRTLVALSRHKGLTPAARGLGVAVPTVHRTARSLVALAGAQLFTPVKNVLEPTAAGDELSRLAGLALRELSAAFVDIGDLRGQATGTISLGAMPLARTDILPDALCDLCATNPHASVEMVEADYDSLLRGLRRGEIDILLGASRGRDAGADVEERVLFEDELSVFARAGHPLAGRRDLTVDELAAFPWVAPRRGAPTRVHFDRLLGGRELAYGLIASSSLVLVRALLARSDRLTLLSRRRILYEEQQGLLVALDVRLPETTRAICITTRRDWRPTRIEQTFVDGLLALR